MAELIADGETGYIFQPRDDRALAEALVSLASDADRRKRFAERQFVRTEERYSLDAMRRTQEENYRRALEKFARRNRTRDGVVLCEDARTAETIAALRASDPAEPVCLICGDPDAAKRKYRVRACRREQAERALRRSQRYLCGGKNTEMAALAGRCGCQISRLPDSEER